MFLRVSFIIRDFFSYGLHVQHEQALLPLHTVNIILLQLILSMSGGMRCQGGCGELMTSRAAKELEFTPTSISRASRQLEEMGLVKTEIKGPDFRATKDIAFITIS